MDKRNISVYFPLNNFHIEFNRKISAYFTYAGFFISMNPITSICPIKKLAELTSTSSAFSYTKNDATPTATSKRNG